jgi:FixJ family two-component response regulator
MKTAQVRRNSDVVTAGRHEEGPTSETIFLIDDDVSVREGLSGLIESVGLPVQTFGSALEFLAAKPVEAEGCVVLDINMPGMNGLELQREMNVSGISLPVIFLTGHGDIPMTVHALKAGAVHFLTKPVREDELMAAIRQALENDREVRSGRAEMRKLRERFDLLAPRERQVMQLVVSGRLNKQIAHELGISERTIKLHRGQVMRKMGAESLADLVKQAEKLGPLRLGARNGGEISQASSSSRSR